LRAIKLADIELAVHPESFQLDPGTQRFFVSLPDARQIGVVDLESGRQTGAWTVPDLKAKFPLAIDEAGARIATVFRNPARFVLLDTKSGAVFANLATCNDADDVFFDPKRQRIYIKGPWMSSRATAPTPISWRRSARRPAVVRRSSCRNSIGSSSPFALACCAPMHRSSCSDRLPDYRPHSA
jgi:hypothetical protein